MTDIISKRNAEHYTWGDSCDAWYLMKRPEMTIIHELMPAGTSEERHYHHRCMQFFFVLSGQAMVELGGRRHTLLAHQGIEVPSDTPHQLRNESSEPLEFIVVSHPDSHGDRVVVNK